MWQNGRKSNPGWGGPGTTKTPGSEEWCVLPGKGRLGYFRLPLDVHTFEGPMSDEPGYLKALRAAQAKKQTGTPARSGGKHSQTPEEAEAVRWGREVAKEELSATPGLGGAGAVAINGDMCVKVLYAKFFGSSDGAD